ncbi:uncharacterized protein LOC114517388 [Dendronephthya gigantea]|uniref:uncharacterized protein LOC114517388 n=1 Tax=Dendronephthya gigantea TaxID=151771 RepID=UPI00106C7E4B|nr:uncharacterized protein LOC114517388 [Dendronephthya gigantea]
MAFVTLQIISVGLLAAVCSASIKLDGQGSSFSSAIKAYEYKTLGEEVTLFEKKFNYVGYVTEQWFTSSADGPFNQYARIRIYIDGEDTASLDFDLTMGQSVNIEQKNNIPWSTRMFGRQANGGGFFNTFRVPFTSGIKITVTNKVNTGALWYIVRGLVGVPLQIGSFQIPISSRLRVYKQNATLAPLDFVTLSNITNKSGMLFLVTFNIQSESPTFMEGCVRANIDNSNETTFLSSGTEDFFLSAFYFNSGEFHGFHSGLAYKSNKPLTEILAYKFFIDDPVLFRKAFILKWRNFEKVGGPGGCPNQFPANENEEASSFNFGTPAKATIHSYVWVYEWDTYAKV